MEFWKLSNSEFEEFCHLLLIRDHPDIKKVEGSGGDAGIDSYTGSILNPDIIFQYKHYQQGRLSYSGRKRRILADIKKASLLKPKEWFLLTSLSLNKTDYEWFEKNLISKYPDIRIKIIEKTKLEYEALQPERKQYIENIFPQLYEFQNVIDRIKKDSLILNLLNNGFIIYNHDHLRFANSREERLCWETGSFSLKDIFDNHDVRRKVIEVIISEITKKKTHGVILFGNPASGKTTVLKRVMIELWNSNYIVFYADSPRDLHTGLLVYTFSTFFEDYKNPVIMIIDNFYTSNSIEYIKFFNEYRYPNLHFLFSSSEANYKNFQKSLTREGLDMVDRANKDLKRINLKLTIGDCKDFCVRTAKIFNKTVDHDKIIQVSKELLTASRNDLLIFLCSLKEIMSRSEKPIFDVESFEKCLENDFSHAANILDQKSLWSDCISCFILTSLGIKITNQVIESLKLDILNLNELKSTNLLVLDSGYFRSKHESWSKGFLNYIIRERFMNSIDIIVSRYSLDNFMFILLDHLSKGELITLLANAGLIAKEGSDLIKALIKRNHEKVYAKFSIIEKSDIYCFGLARFHIALDETDQALTVFEKSLEFNPDNFAAYNNLGNVYEKRRDYTRAIELYQSAKNKNPKSAEPDYNIAQIMLLQGKLHQALYHIDLSISMDDKFLPSHGVRGNILAEMKRLPEARNSYLKILNTDKNNNISILGLGNVNFYRLIEKFPQSNYNLINQNLGYDDISLICEMLNFYHKYVELYPFDKEGHYNLGKSQTLLGFIISSIENLDKALSIEPENTHILLSQMNNYIFVKDFITVEKYIKKILKIDPNNIVALLNHYSMMISRYYNYNLFRGQIYAQPYEK